MRAAHFILLLFLVLLEFQPCKAQRKAPLTNEDIIEMTKGGLGDLSITAAIEANDTDFDIDPKALIKLKNSGVSDSVLSAMQRTKPKLPAAHSSAFPSEPGIYANNAGQLVELGAEVVNYRTGGAAEKLLTGMDKGYTNGVVNGAHSRTHVCAQCQFVLVTFEGITPSEYLLIRLDEKKDHREYRQETVHMFGKSSGPGRSAIQFDFHGLAPRTYRIDIGILAQGEYGFLPPIGLDNKNAQGNGRILTFSVE
jgi:hypothetical protein